MKLLVIAVGGACGALARYGVTVAAQTLAGLAFPWGTLVVNVTGCFGLGVVARALDTPAVSPDLRALLGVGFLGAFTTFSTFSFEAISLYRSGAALRAATYVVGSVVLGLAAVAVGLAFGSLLLRAAGVHR